MKRKMIYFIFILSLIWPNITLAQPSSKKPTHSVRHSIHPSHQKHNFLQHERGMTTPLPAYLKKISFQELAQKLAPWRSFSFLKRSQPISLDLGKKENSLNYQGELPPMQFIALSIDPTTKKIEWVKPPIKPYLEQLAKEAQDAIKRAPKWLREDLARNMVLLSKDNQIRYGKLILSVKDPNQVDEVAFLVARIPPQELQAKTFVPQLILDNAAAIYDHAKHLPYVELVEVGQAGKDDDYYTTARYTGLRNGKEVHWKLPRDIYYWYVVHPKLDAEKLTYVDPATGDPAPAPKGVFWRNYLWSGGKVRDNYTGHFIHFHPNLLKTSQMEKWGPVGAGSVSSTLIEPLTLFRDVQKKQPVMIKFVWGKQVIPKTKRTEPDGVVLATTIALEKGYEQGHPEAMENFLSFWKVDKAIPTGGIVAVVKDRDPFGKPTIVNWLKAKKFQVKVFSSKDLATMTLSNKDASGQEMLAYYKIIIPSDQPKSFYENLAKHKKRLEHFVWIGGTLEMHLYTSHPLVDDPSAFDLPCGVKTTPQDKNTFDAVIFDGRPTIMQALSKVKYLWDGKVYKKRSGDLPLPKNPMALDTLAWWGGQTVPRNVREWRVTQHKTPQRTSQPVRIVWNHFGNCGECQDILTAGGRTALFPIRGVSNSHEDHVWNQVYIDGRWISYQLSWSDVEWHIDNPAVCMGKKFGGGKWISMVQAWRGDMMLSNVTPTYADTFQANVEVSEQGKRLVPGALVLFYSQTYYDKRRLLPGLWGFSDAKGRFALDLGIKQDYFLRILSPIGNYPISGTRLTYDFREAAATKGAVLHVSKIIGGHLKEGVPQIVPPPDPIAGKNILEIQGNWKKGATIRYGKSIYGGYNYFVHSKAPTSASIFVTDQENFDLFKAGKNFKSFLKLEGKKEESFQLQLPLDKKYYLILSNLKDLSLALQSELSLKFKELEGPKEEKKEESLSSSEKTDVEQSSSAQDGGAPEKISTSDSSQTTQDSSTAAAGGCGCSQNSQPPLSFILFLFLLFPIFLSKKSSKN